MPWELNGMRLYVKPEKNGMEFYWTKNDTGTEKIATVLANVFGSPFLKRQELWSVPPYSELRYLPRKANGYFRAVTIVAVRDGSNLHDPYTDNFEAETRSLEQYPQEIDIRSSSSVVVLHDDVFKSSDDNYHSVIYSDSASACARIGGYQGRFLVSSVRDASYANECSLSGPIAWRVQLEY